MKNSIEILNEMDKVIEAQRNVPEDAPHRGEQIAELQGEHNQLKAQLNAKLTEEAEARNSGGAPVAKKHLTVARMALGERAAFEGIDVGFKAAVTIPAPAEVNDPSIPAFADFPRGFADSLLQAGTTGAVSFLRRKTRTNAAAQWASGSKAASAFEYEAATAPLTWIAHHTPIEKTQASDYPQLQSIIDNEMMVGLSQAKSAAAISSNNVAGIVGIKNTVGIQTYTKKTGDNVYDHIRRMATLCYIKSGFRPTHVAVSPQVKEELDLLKGDDGHYLVINVGGRVWGLEVVEDLGMTSTTGTVGVDLTTHNAAIVYSKIGATWYTKEDDTIDIGLVANQFIENAFTLLAESRNAMAVKYPDAFVYMADAIDAVVEA